MKRCFTCVKSQCCFLPVCGWYKVNRAPWDKAITAFFAILLADRSSVPWINHSWFALTPDLACIVRKRASRTTSAWVSTTRILSQQDQESHASISTAIRLTSASTPPAAITLYVRMFVLWQARYCLQWRVSVCLFVWWTIVLKSCHLPCCSVDVSGKRTEAKYLLWLRCCRRSVKKFLWTIDSRH